MTTVARDYEVKMTALKSIPQTTTKSELSFETAVISILDLNTYCIDESSAYKRIETPIAHTNLNAYAAPDYHGDNRHAKVK